MGDMPPKLPTRTTPMATQAPLLLVTRQLLQLRLPPPSLLPPVYPGGTRNSSRGRGRGGRATRSCRFHRVSPVCPKGAPGGSKRGCRRSRAQGVA